MIKIKIEAIEAGIIGCIMILSFHIFWYVLIFFGTTEAAVDYLSWIHFIKPAYQVKEFASYIAIYLLITVSFIGFIFGYIFTKILNFFASDHKVTSNWA